MNYIKIINGERHCKPASQIVVIKDGYQHFNPSEEMLIEDGWALEDVVIEEISEKEITDNEIMEDIDILKDALAASDYKVIKCIEAYLCGEEMPYDVQELHEERNSFRERINMLEEQL